MDGVLVLIGGAEDRKGEKYILKEILKISKSKHIGIITTALNRDPLESFDRYVEAFKEFNIRPISIDIRSSNEAKLEENLDILDEIDTIYFTGGDQLRLSKILLDTRFLDKLRQKVKDKSITYVGTSAGAAIVGGISIFDGDYQPYIKGVVDDCVGFGLIEDYIIDTHFLKRDRIPRLIQGLVSTNYTKGIGIDEDTALFIEDGECKVIGKSEVVVIDIAKSSTNYGDKGTGDSFFVENVDINIYGDKGTFSV